MSIPLFSVCMPVYNGMPYLVDQLESIRNQTIADLEVIIVDDFSNDSSVEYIRGILAIDPRVLLIQHSSNLGVLKALETAISYAKSQWIFLADQDDLWRIDKAERFIHHIRKCNDITLVASNAYVISQYGEDYQRTRLFYSSPPVLTFMNTVIKNRHVGALLAVQKQFLINYCLPFPLGSGYHDQWIALCCYATCSKYHFIDLPLVTYRRHIACLTGKNNKTNLFTMLKSRTCLLINLLIRIMLALYTNMRT